MPINILMPALSPTMEKGNLAKWLKKEGDKVKSGDIIAEIETDKATMEVEATDEGTLGQILVPEGTADVAVNTPIATILADGENAADLAKAPPPKPAQPTPSVAQEVAESRSPVGEGKPMIAAPKAPSAPVAVTEPDPEVPAGTEMVTISVPSGTSGSGSATACGAAGAFGAEIIGLPSPTGEREEATSCATLGEGSPACGTSAGALTRSEALSPSAKMVAIGVLTATSAVPSGIRIWPRVPSSVASTSIVALSVSISAMTSPDLIDSPSFFSHLARLPFSMVGDSAGINT